jgi:hypothetical protein
VRRIGMLRALEHAYVVRGSDDRLHLISRGDRSPRLFG